MTARRPITAVVRRRAWGELGVRPWVFLMFMLLIVSAFMAIQWYRAWRAEVNLIRHGTPISAEVTSIGLGANARQGQRDEPVFVQLDYTPPGAAGPVSVAGLLPRKPGEIVALKQKMVVRIDPQNPMQWTERTEPAPLGSGMIAPGLCGVVAVGCGLLAVVQRRGVLAAFATAVPRRATVVSVRQSPLAPFSKLIGVTLDADPDAPAAPGIGTGTAAPDRRVRDCYWPNDHGAVHPKQTIEVLAGKRRIFAAAAYDVAGNAAAGEVLG